MAQINPFSIVIFMGGFCYLFDGSNVFLGKSGKLIYTRIFIFMLHVLGLVEMGRILDIS